jgi:hypothetical protein
MPNGLVFDVNETLLNLRALLEVLGCGGVVLGHQFLCRCHLDVPAVSAQPVARGRI